MVRSDLGGMRWLIPAIGLILLASFSVLTGPSPVSAAGFKSPSECEPYTGDEHLTCLYGYIAALQGQAGSARTGAETENEDNRLTADPPAAPHRVAPPSLASAPSVPVTQGPEECRAYTGAAHLNCLYAYIEIQQAKTQSELKTHQDMLAQLKAQTDQQASATADLQRRLAEKESAQVSPPVAVVPPYVAPAYPGYLYPGYPYPGYLYPRVYPPVGLSLYFGVPLYRHGYGFYGPRWHHRH